ncbi:hypothetical protein IQ273_13390 [Nodosilinea sp. LEGE 07298]|nr:hypothetical protein [Nodosilinea sp. LEGE 07298]
MLSAGLPAQSKFARCQRAVDNYSCNRRLNHKFCKRSISGCPPCRRLCGRAKKLSILQGGKGRFRSSAIRCGNWENRLG